MRGLQPIAEGCFESAPKIVRVPDGTLMAFCTEPAPGDAPIRARYSQDHGIHWSEPRTVLSREGLPAGLGPVIEAAVDREGEIHAFMLNQWTPDSRGEGERGGAGAYDGRRIDIWYTRSRQCRLVWDKVRCIWEGYTGALNSSLVLRSGRILLPFSYYVPRTWRERGPGLQAYTFAGMFDAVVLYSDDGGSSWKLSNSLWVQTPDITYAYGACEPVAVERHDGSAWMLLRTQMGRFYETASPDGAVWSSPRPTSIVSSDSPAGLVRLCDGRLVMIWNMCLRHPYAYGGRHVVHAAISEDDGVTWRGYREVGRDPKRGEPPPPHGDHGTAYPFPVVTSDNAVIISTGQGKGRALLMRMEPGYLLATRQKTDFTKGLEDWSVFGTRGVELGQHPGSTTARVLSLCRKDKDWPAAAVWNFPSGRRGSLTLRLKGEAGSGRLAMGLTDHFSPPFDAEDEIHGLAVFCIEAVGGIPPGGTGEGAKMLPEDGVRIPRGQWTQLVLRWNLDRCQCAVRTGAGPAVRFRMQRNSPGVCYLRLKVTGDVQPVSAAWLVESVEARSLR